MIFYSELRTTFILNSLILNYHHKPFVFKETLKKFQNPNSIPFLVAFLSLQHLQVWTLLELVKPSLLPRSFSHTVKCASPWELSSDANWTEKNTTRKGGWIVFSQTFKSFRKKKKVSDISLEWRIFLSIEQKCKQF